MPTLDLNCDLGEGAGHDAELMPFISSANIACGAHAGDERTMRETIALALRHRVAIGAHPGFEDRANFGRTELRLAPADVRALVLRQVRALQTLAVAQGGRVVHVKPHGALYNMAARDAGLANAVAEAVREADPGLFLVGLANSELIRAGENCRLETVGEAFADRSYQADGSLTPRSQPGALVEDEESAVAQVLRMVREGRVRARDGRDVLLVAQTICLHGDGAHAVAFARRLHSALGAEGVTIQSPAA